MNNTPKLDDLTAYPRMTRWFNPVLLAKLLLRVVIAGLFGQYADRRLIHAALDTVPKKELRDRADLSCAFVPDAEGAVWIDYVSDLGDGFDATYAIAYLVAQEALTVEGHDMPLPRGGALFMGGDQVYPTASRNDYNVKLRAPYRFAFPNRHRRPHPPVFMIPGNHDWYDGLASFLAMFCREKHTSVGNWLTHQRRSYFAVKLTETCWVWGIDIALTEDMDQPQASYFFAIAEGMPEGASIILCTAKPGWYENDDGAKAKAASYRSLVYAANIAKNANRNLHVPLVLSGDTHHYCRYSGASDTQFITSGGGGAFLHGTHQLKDKIKVPWLSERDFVLSLMTEPGEGQPPSAKPACYPSKERSKELLSGNFAFPVLNWDFSLLLGALFFAFGFVLSQAPRVDLTFIFLLVFAAGFCTYSGYQEGWKPKVVLLSVAHAVVQFAALSGLVWLAVQADSRWLQLHEGSWWGWFLILGVALIPLGGLIAGLIFGIYLYLTCRYADMSHNDAFSAMRLDSYRHFLRVRITPETMTIFAIGIDTVPRRQGWTTNPTDGGSTFVPRVPLAVHLIEQPIIIRRPAASTTAEVKQSSDESSNQR